jgi:putative peptide zinc metalloprotease protein
MQDSAPQVLAYTVQPDSDGFIIGSPARGSFLCVPAEVVEILRAFEAGHGPAQVSADFQARHGEAPDLADLIQVLTRHGILADAAAADAPADAAPAKPARRYHFEWITPRLARLVWNRYTLALMALLVAAALLVLVRDPQLLPGWRAFYFPQDTATQVLGLMLLGMLSTFVHEMSHLTAARAAGVSCRFSIGNQLWFVVWYTEMTGIWALPRRRRYLPILAGPLVDLVSAACIVLFLAAAGTQGWALPPLTRNILSALLFLYLVRIIWQCYFFVRTDFYYAFTNLLGCKRLMQDTEDWLRNRWARLRGRPDKVDQSGLPVHERRMLPGYAVIWVAGRGIALSMLFLVQLPLFVSYLFLLFESLGAPSSGKGPSASALLAGLLFSTLLIAGLVMWLRQLLLRKG